MRRIAQPLASVATAIIALYGWPCAVEAQNAQAAPAEPPAAASAPQEAQPELETKAQAPAKNAAPPVGPEEDIQGPRSTFSCEALETDQTPTSSRETDPTITRAERLILERRHAQQLLPAAAEKAAAQATFELRTRDAEKAAAEAFPLIQFQQLHAEAEARSASATLKRLEAQTRLALANERLQKAAAAGKGALPSELEQNRSEREAADRAVQTAKEAESAAKCAAEKAGEALAAAVEVARLESQLAATVDDAARGPLAQRVASEKLRAADLSFMAKLALKDHAARDALVTKDQESSDEDSAQLSNGARISWEIAASLLRFHTQRSENLAGRVRNYRPRLEFIPGEVGFQFLVEPAGVPWRLNRKNGESLQLISWGGLLLASLGENDAFERGSLSLAATVSFFENNVGLGLGFDLYRGIPVLGSDGTPGGGTAFTGVLAWALAHEGEVTAENAFVVVTVNLSTLVKAVSGDEDDE